MSDDIGILWPKPGKIADTPVADWEMKLDPREVDRQTILAIEGSSKRLRPDNWETILAETKKRLDGEQTSQSATGVSAIFPGLGHKIPISSDN